MRVALKLVLVALIALVASSDWAVSQQTPTRGGQTIDEWRRSANTHARIVRKLRRANRERIALGANGIARGLLCIHSFEGSWTDDGAPFWGGLQMDASFQRAYGGEFMRALGTADNWPAFVQVAVGMRAYYSGRGFTPWPNTRRMCGL